MSPQNQSQSQGDDHFSHSWNPYQGCLDSLSKSPPCMASLVFASHINGQNSRKATNHGKKPPKPKRNKRGKRKNKKQNRPTTKNGLAGVVFSWRRRLAAVLLRQPRRGELRRPEELLQRRAQRRVDLVGAAVGRWGGGRRGFRNW